MMPKPRKVLLFDLVTQPNRPITQSLKEFAEVGINGGNGVPAWFPEPIVYGRVIDGCCDLIYITFMRPEELL